MSPERRWRFRIRDILDAIELIYEYTSEMNYEQFINDPKTIDAVVRRIAIIGEAASHIPREIMSLNQDIDWHIMKGMRNVVIHEYFGVSKKIVWDTVKDDLPKIAQPLKQLLSLTEK